MMHANSTDSNKITDVVVAILDAATKKGAKFVFVESRTLYKDCKLSHLRYPLFEEEVSDVLTDSAINHHYGMWLYTEVGDGYSAFLQVSDKDTPVVKLIQALIAEGKAMNLHSPKLAQRIAEWDASEAEDAKADAKQQADKEDKDARKPEAADDESFALRA